MFSLCKPVTSRKRFLPHRTLNSNYTFTLFDKSERVPADEWHQVVSAEDLFMDLHYLGVVEQCVHTRLQARYVVVYHKKKVIGALYFQVVDFRGEIFSEVIQREMKEQASKRLGIFEHYVEMKKDDVLMRLVTNGNNLISGEYGFRFSNTLTSEQQLEIVLQVTDVVAKEERLSKTISAVLIKDYHQPLEPEWLLEEDHYLPFDVEPNLVVDLPFGTSTLDAYIGLFSKKYRNRAKTILKKRDNLRVVNLTAEETTQHEQAIYALYEQVFNNAQFKLVKLPVCYFREAKKRFGERFVMKAFFLDQQLVAFASGFILADKSFEAHYIGLDYEFNQQYELYQNILYCLLAEAMAHNCVKVDLGRTAAEIKTTVGARAQPLHCYLKPQNAVSKLIQKPFVKLLAPSAFTPRNPFKETELAESTAS